MYSDASRSSSATGSPSLRTKIEAFRTKKEVIKAQYSAAEAQVRISEAATGVGEQMADVGLAMQRAVDDDLARMKAELGAGSGGSQAQLGQGTAEPAKEGGAA